MNSFPFTLGSICLSRLSLYKVWLSFITFLRKQTANLGTLKSRKFNWIPYSYQLKVMGGKESRKMRSLKIGAQKENANRKFLIWTLLWRNGNRPVFVGFHFCSTERGNQDLLLVVTDVWILTVIANVLLLEHCLSVKLIRFCLKVLQKYCGRWPSVHHLDQ